MALSYCHCGYMIDDDDVTGKKMAKHQDQMHSGQAVPEPAPVQATEPVEQTLEKERDEAAKKK